MNENPTLTTFGDGEECEYCGGLIFEKMVTVHRQVAGSYYLFEDVPAGVCRECGTRYYAANVLKRMDESIAGRQKATRQILVPVFVA